MLRIGVKSAKRRILLTGLIALLGVLTVSLQAPSHAASQVLAQDRYELAIFAGGCFWCMEEAFDGVEGVVSTQSGYTGGRMKNPTYSEVSAGRTKHAEAVQVRYDPQKVSYTDLLEVFWRNIDPTTPDRQFCDIGPQYRSAIFYNTKEQKRLAETSRDTLARSKPFKEALVTEITAASAFYPAEEYHQDYYTKNPARYTIYKYSCGRTKRLKELWG